MLWRISLVLKFVSKQKIFTSFVFTCCCNGGVMTYGIRAGSPLQHWIVTPPTVLNI
jgi:hypothetical protein